MEKLKDALVAFNLSNDNEIIQRFEDYMNLILSWNEKVNMTAIKDRDEFIVKHFIDSLCCADNGHYMDAESIIDVGTGAGFPGIPLALVSPDKEFLLIDSLKKRIRIIDEIIDKLQIKNVRTAHGRAEDLAREGMYRQKFDICVSRAVSRLSVLVEYCLPFVKKGGWFIAYKGTDADLEAEDSKNSISLLGGSLYGICDANMNKYGVFHRMVYINKIKDTPKEYPRRAGIPVKRPL